MKRVANRLWLGFNVAAGIVAAVSIVGTIGSMDLLRISNAQAAVQIVLAALIGAGTWLSEVYRRAYME